MFPSDFGYNDKLTFRGCRVLISPDHPKMQLSEDCPVTPEFRKEMNAWMRDFFGVNNLIPDGQFLHCRDFAGHNAHGGFITMNIRTYRQFVDLTEKYLFKPLL